MVGLIIALLRIYEILIIIRALLSWFHLNPRHPAVQLLVESTEPVLGPIRRYTVFGGLDLSPIVVILVIQLIIGFLR
jgi:YggT family protein